MIFNVDLCILYMLGVLVEDESLVILDRLRDVTQRAVQLEVTMVYISHVYLLKSSLLCKCILFFIFLT